MNKADIFQSLKEATYNAIDLADKAKDRVVEGWIKIRMEELILKT